MRITAHQKGNLGVLVSQRGPKHRHTSNLTKASFNTKSRNSKSKIEATKVRKQNSEAPRTEAKKVQAKKQSANQKNCEGYGHRSQDTRWKKWRADTETQNRRTDKEDWLTDRAQVRCPQGGKPDKGTKWKLRHDTSELQLKLSSFETSVGTTLCSEPCDAFNNP